MHAHAWVSGPVTIGGAARPCERPLQSARVCGARGVPAPWGAPSRWGRVVSARCAFLPHDTAGVSRPLPGVRRWSGATSGWACPGSARAFGTPHQGSTRLRTRPRGTRVCKAPVRVYRPRGLGLHRTRGRPRTTSKPSPSKVPPPAPAGSVGFQQAGLSHGQLRRAHTHTCVCRTLAHRPPPQKPSRSRRCSVSRRWARRRRLPVPGGGGDG